jgi:hypothetical protein
MSVAGARAPYFPTRQYPYRAERPGAAAELATDPLAGIPAGSVVRFFLGQDEEPAAIQTADIPQFINDPFARLVLAAGHRPKTPLEVLAILNIATGADAVPGQRIYRVADGGQISWTESTASLDRHLRIVVTRHRGEEAELFISTAPPFASDAVFLQIFAWDPQSAAYNFYERRRGVWSWAGSSWQALQEPTRGHGPFDSHVNGGPVMKELKLPWLHWHSQSSQIRDDILAPDDPLRNDAFYHSTDLKGGDDLELIVRSGTTRWTRSRLDRRTADGRLQNAREFLAQVLTTTTVNLTCSPQPSASLADSDMLRLPTTFFINADCLIDELALPATLLRAKAPASFYRACLSRYAVRLQDGPNILDRDAYFAFPVPEPSLEDLATLRELLARGALSRRLALALLLVDFPNPIFSERRASLLAYVPDEIQLNGGADLDRRFGDAVRPAANARGADSAEAEFMRMWAMGDDWETAFADRVARYWAAVQSQLATQAGFDAFFQLAESRRRQFRKRPLAEFGLTLPIASELDLPVFLEVTEQAQVRPL